MERFAGRLALCIPVTFASLLTGCIIPIPLAATPQSVAPATTPVSVAPIRVVPILAPIVPRAPTPVPTLPVIPVTTCNIFNTACPTTGGGDGGDDGGGVWN